MRVGYIAEEVSYWSSKKRPAFDAVGVRADLVVVKLSNTNAAYESLLESGVEEKERKAERRCDLSVVFPEPDSPLCHCVRFELWCHNVERLHVLKIGINLQENNSLVLAAMSQSSPSSRGQLFGCCHGTALLSAIWTSR
jgi:hypothetical protein